MSWLSDHLFGSAKPNEQKTAENKPSNGDVAEQMEAGTNTEPEEAAPRPFATTESTGDNLYDQREVVAEWRVPLHGKLHKIEFEHGTTTGKRVLWIDEKEEFRRDWMFKLVGDDVFYLEKIRCVLRVDPAPAFKYKYSLFVDGKPFEQFKQRQAKALRIWEATVGDHEYRVVLEKDTLNIFVNGTLREEEGEFVDVGTETRWEEHGNAFVLAAYASGNKREGVVHSLTINGNKIDEAAVDA